MKSVLLKSILVLLSFAQVRFSVGGIALWVNDCMSISPLPSSDSFTPSKLLPWVLTCPWHWLIWAGLQAAYPSPELRNKAEHFGTILLEALFLFSFEDFIVSPWGKRNGVKKEEFREHKEWGQKRQ